MTRLVGCLLQSLENCLTDCSKCPPSEEGQYVIMCNFHRPLPRINVLDNLPGKILFNILSRCKRLSTVDVFVKSALIMIDWLWALCSTSRGKTAYITSSFLFCPVRENREQAFVILCKQENWGNIIKNCNAHRSICSATKNNWQEFFFSIVLESYQKSRFTSHEGLILLLYLREVGAVIV